MITLVKALVDLGVSLEAKRGKESGSLVDIRHLMSNMETEMFVYNFETHGNKE